MSTTQRSESMNAFFDGYVNSKTSLKQFVEQYKRALRSKVEKEFQADFRSYSAMIPCLTNYGLEKQIQQVYTIEKFKEVQSELIQMTFCDVFSLDDEFLGTRSTSSSSHMCALALRMWERSSSSFAIVLDPTVLDSPSSYLK
ncbi:Protein FAR1-RELATED SEQUENCE 5 [Abeliophyllum distichum]|uniref:Protein FAR1-RELATED SEQUENCE n=1 Tax=Abeliophyllum distichum TaxID=126358 RepID=A0ABD1PRZ1_9LAMI